MKKTFAVIMAVCILLAMMSGCSIVKSKGRYNTDKYVTLGQYKGVEIDKVEVTPVTQEDIDAYVRQDLLKYAEKIDITDRPAQQWDTVNIDYVGTLNGEPFDGGTASAQDLTLGSNKYIAGFEDGLIGATVGETVTLNLTFPEDYSKVYDELNGQAVVFTVTVNSITEDKLPDITPEFAQEKLGVETEEAYLEGVRKILEAQNEEAAMAERQKAAWAKVFAAATIKGYPKSETNALYKEKYAYYQQYAQEYGVTMDALIDQVYGMTAEEFENQLLSWVYEEMEYTMVVHAIAAEEGLSLTQSEYKAGYEKYLKQTGYDSEQAFYEASGTTFEEYFGKEALEDNILADKVLRFLAENAVEK